MKISRQFAFTLALATLLASAGLWAFQHDKTAGSPVQVAENSVADVTPVAKDSASSSTTASDSRAAGMSSRINGGRAVKPRPLADKRLQGDAAAPAALGQDGADAPKAKSDNAAADRAVSEAKLSPDAPRTPAQPEQKAAATTFAFGLGGERLPRWLGAAGSKAWAVPYVNINWQDRVEFSTVDGLIVDLLHGEHWHGGVVGTMMWGRSRNDLGRLADRVPTRSNTLQAGAYIEYAVTKDLSVGMRLRHDIQPTDAAYGDIYADLDLPSVGYMEHSVRVAGEAMKRSAMRRFFGLSPEEAARLGTSAYQPNGGRSQVSVAYDAFVPTSQATGVAFAASYGRLSQAAAGSPLVRNFGSPHQRNLMAAFVYHF